MEETRYYIASQRTTNNNTGRESELLTLYEDEALKIVMYKDFLEHPERYEVGKGIQHIYKRDGWTLTCLS